MFVKKEVLTAILKRTQREAKATIEDICMEARVPRTTALEIFSKLNEDDLLRIDCDKVIVNRRQRLKIAIKSISLGSDVEIIARLLTWSEFEQFSKESLELNGFRVILNFHFSWLGKRWEIDLIGVKRPLVISADCKCWRRGWSGSASVKAAISQVERTRSLADASRKIKDKVGISGWKYAYFVPVIFSLHPSQYKFCEKTPIVPILQINDFLQNLIVHLNEITHFYVQYV